MKKNLFRLFSLLAVSLVGTTAIIALASNGFKFVANDGTPDPGYSIVLDESNAPFIEETYDRELGPEKVFENGDYALNLKYRLAKSEAGYHVTLAPHGFMYNEVDDSTYNNRITSFLSITPTYSSTSSISIRTSLSDDGKEFGAPQTVASGATLTLTDNPYYFIIEAGDAEAKIESVVLNYSCAVKTSVVLSTLSGTYTGVGDDGYTYKLALKGASATIESLDKEVNVSFSGTAEIVENNKIKCTLSVMGNPGYYTATVSADHSKLEFASKSGAAATFPEIDFCKVYKVEDFELESALGQGFGGSGRANTPESIYDMSGTKAHWHAEWYNNGSYSYSLLGKAGGDSYAWKLIPGSDYMTYSGTKGHGVSGSKTCAFKLNSNKLRYIQMKGLLGTPNIIGRGSYLSFWAKGFQDSALTTIRSTDVSISVYGFYNQTITKDNSTSRSSGAVTIVGGSDWKKYTIELDSSKDYYAFGFYSESSTQVYLAIDDVEIYTVDPDAEYVAPVAATGVTVDPSVLALDVGQHSTLTATVAPADATNKNVAWSTSNDAVATVSNEGVVTAVGAGNATITATAQDGGWTDTCAVTVSLPSSIPYPEGTFFAEISSYKLVIALGNETNGLVAVRISTADVTPTGITFDDTDGTFTITTTGSVGGYTVGNITGVYDYANDRLLHVGCSGQIGAAVSDVTLTRPETLLNCDLSTSQLQALIKRRYRQSDKWNVDATNTDRVVSVTDNVLSGTSSMTVRPCGSSFQGYGFSLNNDFASPKTLANFHCWVYNPCDYDMKLRVYYFKAAGLNSAGQVGLGSADTVKAHSWTYISRGFTSSSVYNFNISVWTEDFASNTSTIMSAKLVFDDILFY